MFRDPEFDPGERRDKTSFANFIATFSLSPPPSLLLPRNQGFKSPFPAILSAKKVSLSPTEVRYEQAVFNGGFVRIFLSKLAGQKLSV